MMKFMRKSKGSISIFLLLVLLPMVTYATLVIDVSRIQSARTVITGAGDLSMNAALSEYELTLQNMYGLFAQVTNEENFEKALEQYFKETIEGSLAKSSGENENRAYTDEFSRQFAEFLVHRDEEITEDDMINFLVMQVDNYQAMSVDGTSLANPAMMKKQIMDYMKYRGPVSLGSNLMSKIGFFGGAAKQAEAAQSKIEYTEELDKINDPCERAYKILTGGTTEDIDESLTGSRMGYYQSAKEYNTFVNNHNGTDELNSYFGEVKNYLKYASQAILAKENNPIPAEDRWKHENMGWTNLANPIRDEMKNQSFDGVGSFNTICSMDEDTAESLAEKLRAFSQLSDKVVNQVQGRKGIYEDDFHTDYYFSGNSLQENQSAGNGFPKKDFLLDEADKLDLSVSNNYKITRGPNGKITNIDKPEQLAISIQVRYSNQQDYINSTQGNGNTNRDIFAKLRAYSLFYSDICGKYNSTTAALRSKMQNYQNCVSKAKDLAEDDEKEYDELSDDDKNEYFKAAQEDKHITDVISLSDYTTYSEMIADASQKIDAMNQIEDDISDYDMVCVGSYLDKLFGDDIYDDIADYYQRKAAQILYYPYFYVCMANKKAGELYTALGAIETSISSAQSKKNAWQGKINEVDDSSAKSNMQADLDTTTDGLKKEDVQKYKAIVEKCKNHFAALKEKFENIKYLDKSIVSYQENKLPDSEGVSYTDFRSLNDFKNKSVNITQQGGVLIKCVEEDFLKRLTSFDDICSLIAKDAPPEITQGKVTLLVNRNNVPDEKFFITLKSVINPKKTEISEDDKTRVDNVKELAKVDKDSGISQAVKDGSGDDSKDNKDNKDNTETQKVSFENYGTTTFEEIKAYSTNRVNLSNDSMNADDYHVATAEVNTNGSKNRDNAEKGKNSLGQATKLLNMIGNLAATAAQYAYLEEYFTENFTCQYDPHLIKREEGDNPSVKPGTWQLLNGYKASTDKNAQLVVNQDTEWFGKELEFILWGDPKIDNNVIKNNALIFTIRFALNLIYAFTAPDIQAFTLQVATATAGWTVIGVPIVKVCLTIAIAMAESAYDLTQLIQGRDVPIYKNASTFVCSPQGLLRTVATDITKKAIEYASDKVTEKFDSTLDKISTKIDEGVDGAQNEIDGAVDEFMQSKQEDIIADIDSRIATPIVNAVSGMVEKARNNRDNLHRIVEEGINEAFNRTKAGLDELEISDGSQAGDDLVLTLSREIIADGTFKNQLISTIEGYINYILDNPTIADSETLHNKLMGVDGEGKPTGVINKRVDQCRQKIQDKLKSLSSEVASKIKEAKNNGVKNIKQYAHEEIDKATQKLSATATKKLEAGIDKYANKITNTAVDSSTTRSITMNYKEYCKIFVLIQLTYGETAMLQRAGVIMEANVQNAKKDANKNFKLTNAETMVYVKADVKLGTLVSWPFAINAGDAPEQNNAEIDTSHLVKQYVKIHYEGYNSY